LGCAPVTAFLALLHALRLTRLLHLRALRRTLLWRRHSALQRRFLPVITAFLALSRALWLTRLLRLRALQRSRRRRLLPLLRGGLPIKESRR
jgi:hypothetical protein